MKLVTLLLYDTQLKYSGGLNFKSLSKNRGSVKFQVRLAKDELGVILILSPAQCPSTTMELVRDFLAGSISLVVNFRISLSPLVVLMVKVVACYQCSPINSKQLNWKWPFLSRYLW